MKTFTWKFQLFSLNRKQYLSVILTNLEEYLINHEILIEEV